MERIIGAGLYGVMSAVSSKTITVPGRLRIVSSTAENDGGGIRSPDPISAVFKDDGLLITYQGNIEFGIEKKILGGLA